MSCSMNVTVIDEEKPVLTCPENKTNNLDEGLSTANVTFDSANVTDNSQIDISPQSNILSGSTFDEGDTEVQFNATDESGNTGTCTFMITVKDTEKPELVDCVDLTFQTSSGLPTANVTYDRPNATDNVQVMSVNCTGVQEDGETLNVGVHVVECVAVDTAGLVGRCMFNITVEDKERPNITCPIEEIIPTDCSSITATYPLPTASVSDNTENYTIMIVVGDFSKSVGDKVSLVLTDGSLTLHILVYTAIDQYGNNMSCSINVTVIDEEEPVLTCPENVTSNLDEGLSTANVIFKSANVTDNSQVDSTPQSNILSGSTFDEGDTEVQFNATDKSGNTGTCTFMITVKDTEEPVLDDCTNLTFPTPLNSSTAYVSYNRPNATDNVGVVSLICSGVQEGGQTLSVGVYLVECIALDKAGLAGRCTFSIAVEATVDFIDPLIFNCPASTSQNTDTGLATASVTWTEPTATDNLGTVDLTSNIPSGFQFPIGPTEVVYTATDPSNNQKTCVFTVTIIDNEKPTLTGCPNNFTLSVVRETDQATATWTPPTVADNSGQVTTAVDNNLLGQQLSLGQYEVTYSATDPAGLIGTCPTFTITVQVAVDACIPNPCLNGGSCSSTSPADGFTCDCTSFWTGASCDEDVDECQQVSTNQACVNQNLICINQLSGSTCGCSVGFFQAGASGNCIRGRRFRFIIVIVEIFNDPAQAVFTNDLNDRNSVAFMRHQERLQLLFVLVFRDLPGFRVVVVLIFTAGSIKVDAVATFDPDSSVTQADVDRALQQAITSGDLLMGSEYKLTPSRTQVIEEVCADGHCLNGGTCTMNTIDYLSSCSCPSGYDGARCEEKTTPDTPDGGGLSTEIIVAIAIGAVVLLLLLLMIPLCAYIVAARGRRSRSDYLYREDYERQPRHAKRHQNGSEYDVQFGTNGINGTRPTTSQFRVPYMATGGPNEIPLFPMERGEADYF